MRFESMPQLQGVIFDVDGTLVNSNYQHARAFHDAFHQKGYDVPLEKIRPLIGMGSEKLVPAALGQALDEEEIQQIGELKSQIFKEKYFHHVQPFPQVRELLLCLKSHPLKLGIASSATGEELKELLKVAQVDDLFEHTTSADDAENSKPDPDIVCAAIEKLDVPQANLLMIGDTPYDLEAAHRAGVQFIGFRCGGWRDEDLKGALRIYDGAWEMDWDACQQGVVEDPRFVAESV